LLGDLREIRGVVGALAQKSVAVDAILAMPHILSLADRRCDAVRVCEGVELAVTVDGEDEKNGREEQRAADEEHAGMSFRHHLLQLARGCRGSVRAWLGQTVMAAQLARTRHTE